MFKACLIFSAEDYFNVEVTIPGFPFRFLAEKFAGTTRLVFDHAAGRLFLVPGPHDATLAYYFTAAGFFDPNTGQRDLTDEMVKVQRIKQAAIDRLKQNGSPIDPSAPGAIEKIMAGAEDGSLCIDSVEDMEDCPITISQFRDVPGLCRGFESIAFGVDAEPGAVEEEVERCRVCGCTDLDCSGCIEKTGEPCYWVEPNLCSACVDD